MSVVRNVSRGVFYLSPVSPKNPIKREKKKLAYSSECEDFIKRERGGLTSWLRGCDRLMIYIYYGGYGMFMFGL